MSARTSARALEKKLLRLRGRRSHLFRVGKVDLELGDELVIGSFLALMGGGPSSLSDRARDHLAQAEPGGRPDCEALLIDEAAGRLAARLADEKEDDMGKQPDPATTAEVRESIAAKVAAFETNPDEYQGTASIVAPEPTPKEDPDGTDED